jgi:hypothetical protein
MPLIFHLVCPFFNNELIFVKAGKVRFELYMKYVLY